MGLRSWILELEGQNSIWQAFEERYKSFSQWLLKHPLDFQTLKENRPADYRELLQLYEEIDRHWLKEDLYSFLKAIEVYQTEHLRVAADGGQK